MTCPSVQMIKLAIIDMLLGVDMSPDIVRESVSNQGKGEVSQLCRKLIL